MINFHILRKTFVTGTVSKPSFGRLTNLADHIEMLAVEFSGKSEFELLHASTIVHIRRKTDLVANVALFNRMWEEETSFLLANLDSRWLVSACDTIADTSESSKQRSTAIMGALFMNTIKLYETERLAVNSGHLLNCNDAVVGERLFDGLSFFNIGRGEMILNMSNRMKRNLQADLFASRIVLELFDRANKHDTVYNRLSKVHFNNDTKWIND